MQAVASQPDWRPGQVTSVSYEGTSPANGPPSTLPDEKPVKRSGPTIRQIRESMSAPDQQMHYRQNTSPLPPPPRKKQSLFSGLFATKEPTQLALSQVQAQMIAQHGSTSATRVPNVRMERMPEHVPKVNSKWDGIPDVVKERERREKDKQKALERQSMLSNASRRRSVESSERRGRRTLLRSADSSSRPHSLSSRAMSSHSNHSDPRSPNPHKFYAQSVNSSGDLAAQLRTDQTPEPSSVYSHSTRSQSATSFPYITTTAAENVPPPPPVPSMYRSSLSTRSRSSEPKSDCKLSKGSQPAFEIAPPRDAIPEHTSSPVATPREGSPVTPSTQQAHEHFSNVRASMISSQGSVPIESAGHIVLPLPVGTKKPIMRPTGEAFFAGEARPLELPDDDDEDEEPQQAGRDLPLRQWGTIRNSFRGSKAPEIPHRSIDRVVQDLSRRPDSSRSRQGLKPSMLVRTDAAPWEPPGNSSALSPQSANARSQLEPSSPRRFAQPFNSLRKKES